MIKIEVMIKKIVIFCFLVWLSHSVFSQHSFEILISNPITESIADIIEEENGYFLTVGGQGEFPTSYDLKGFIMRISPCGDTVFRTYNRNDTIFTFMNILKTNNNNYYIFGTLTYPPNYYHELLVCQIDSGLNLLWYKSYLFPGYNRLFGIKSLHSSDGVIMAMMVYNSTYGISNLQLVKICSSGDTINAKCFPELSNGAEVKDMLYNADSTEFWIFGSGYNHTGIGSRLIFDNDFTLLSSQVLPNSVDLYFDSKWISDSTLIFSGSYTHFHSNPQDDDIGISETDPSYTNMDIHYFGAVDTMDYPAWDKSIDFNHPDTIFYAGWHNVIPDFYPQGYNWIMLGQLNRQLQPRYEKYFGGDAYYITGHILSTSDGGCIVTAERYDYQIQDYEFDIYIMKLRREDIITPVNYYSQTKLSNVMVYPNPGHDIIQIKSGLKGAVFQLYDSKGLPVIEVKLSNELTSIYCNKLPVACYYYNVIYKSQSYTSGKWIKH